MTADDTWNSASNDFSDEDIDRLAVLIGVTASWQSEFSQRMRRAARVHWFLRATDDLRASKKDLRNQLDKIARASSNLENLLVQYEEMWAEGRIDTSVYRSAASDLAALATTLKIEVPGSGPWPRTARHRFAYDLGVLFRDVRGRRPTLARSVDRGKMSGLFYEFVEQALLCLNCPHETQGLETDVRRVVEALRRD